MDARSGGGQAELAATLRSFEGLVFTTAQMYAGQVRREPDDLAQELRVRVWRAVTTFDPTRSRQSLERYVFSAITNKIKDYKRDAAREAKRREDTGLTFIQVDDVFLLTHYHFVTHDEVFAQVENESFEMPATVTGDERRVLALLIFGYTRAEVAREMQRTRVEVDEVVRELRGKLADWRPSGGPAPARPAVAA